MNPIEPNTANAQVPWGLRDLLFAILFAAGGILALNIAVLGWSAFLRQPLAENGTILILSVFVQDSILIGAAGWFGAARHRVGWAELGLRRFDVAQGCLLSAALFILSYVARICYVVTAMALGVNLQPQAVLGRLDVSGWNALWTFFGVAIFAPIVEEIFFRGFVYAGLRKRIGVLGALFASTLFFTALHFSIDLFIPIFVLGLFLAWLYEKTGSLYPGIFLHISNNALAMLVLFLMQAAGIQLQ